MTEDEENQLCDLIQNYLRLVNLAAYKDEKGIIQVDGSLLNSNGLAPMFKWVDSLLAQVRMKVVDDVLNRVDAIIFAYGDTDTLIRVRELRKQLLKAEGHKEE